jgi:hypothetical protein
MPVRAQQSCDCPLVERIACCGGDFAVGCDLSFRDGADDAPESGVARLVFAKAIFQDSSLEVLWNGWASHELNCIKG